MLIPSTEVVFEGLSRDYRDRLEALAAAGFDGCARLAFPDLEGVVFYEQGRPVTALEESGTWMALGEELIAPLENKAAVADGSMAIYALSPALIGFFKGRRIASTVETETGPLLSPQALLDNLLRDRSACILKAWGPSWIGYALVAAGRVIDAAFASGQEQLAGDRAAGAIRRAEGRATAAMYFLEGGAPFVEEAPPEEVPAEAPPEAAAPPPPAAPEIPEVGLKVATFGGPGLRPRHPSRLTALETLEDRSIVWVDQETLDLLGVKDAGAASLVLPGGRSEQVTLLRMDLLSGPGNVAVVPRKLRRRLELVPGALVTLKPGSALVPVR